MHYKLNQKAFIISTTTASQYTIRDTWYIADTIHDTFSADEDHVVRHVGWPTWSLRRGPSRPPYMTPCACGSVRRGRSRPPYTPPCPCVFRPQTTALPGYGSGLPRRLRLQPLHVRAGRLRGRAAGRRPAVVGAARQPPAQAARHDQLGLHERRAPGCDGAGEPHESQGGRRHRPTVHVAERQLRA